MNRLDKICLLLLFATAHLTEAAPPVTGGGVPVTVNANGDVLPAIAINYSAGNLKVGGVAVTTPSDTALAASWNGVTTIPPTKNAIYDYVHLFDTDDDGKVNVLDLAAGIPKTDSSGVLSLAVAGTDFVSPSGTLALGGFGSITGGLSYLTGGSHAYRDMPDAANDFIDLALVGKSTSDEPLFTTRNDAGSIYVRNTTGWAANFDLTAFSVYNNEAGAGNSNKTAVAISPRHVLLASHFYPAIGTTIRWVTKDNVVVERQLSSVSSLISTDIRIGYLSSDLPSTISFSRVLTATQAGYFVASGSSTTPVLYTDQNQKAYVAETTVLSATSPIIIAQSISSPRSTFYHAPITYDSSHPICLIIDGKPVVLTSMYSISPSIGGPTMTANYAAINSAMTSLGGSYQLTPLEISLLPLIYNDLVSNVSFRVDGQNSSEFYVGPGSGNEGVFLTDDTGNVIFEVDPDTGAITTGIWGGTVIPATKGGTGVANNAAATLTRSGNFAQTVTLTGVTNNTYPTSGTLATLDGTETFTNKSIVASQLTGTVATARLGSGTANSSSYLRGDQTWATLAAATTISNDTIWDALGDLVYGSAADTGSKLSGNTTATKKFLTQTGNGSVSAAPGWNTIVAGDIPDLSATYQPLDSDLTSWAAITRASGFDTFTATPSIANLFSLVTGEGTGVATALGVNVGSAGAFVTFNGALGTPSSGTLTNCTFPTLNQNTSGSAGSLSISGQTGLLTFTGLASTSRIKTVRDAADTILELGGSYTPTGTWTSMTLVTPALGTPASGTLTNCTSLPIGSGVSGLGTGVATFLGTPTYANLNTMVSDADLARTDAANSFTGNQTLSDALVVPGGGLSSYTDGSTRQVLFAANGYFDGNSTWHYIDLAKPGWRFDLAANTNAAGDLFSIYYRAASAAANSWTSKMSLDSSGNLTLAGNIGRFATTKGIVGSNTNDSAASTIVGEYVSASVVQGSATALTTATPKTVTSISLTAGDWDITAIGATTGAATGTAFDVAIGTTTNSLTGTVLGDTRCETPTVSLTGADTSLMIPAVRVSISGTTTYYLIVQETFTIGSPAAYGRISARRVR